MKNMLAELIIAQTEVAPVTPTTPADPWTQYAVYGAIGLFILFFFFRALRSKPPQKVDGAEEPPTIEAPPAEEVKQPPAFKQPQIILGDADEGLRVRLTDDNPPPTGGDAQSTAERVAKNTSAAQDNLEKKVRAGLAAEEAAAAKAQTEANAAAEADRKASAANARKAEQARKATERKAEQARKTAERKAEKARKATAAAEARKAEEARKTAERAAEKARELEEIRLAEEARVAEEARKIAETEAAGKTLREGLARTHDGFVKKLGKLFGSAKTMDDDMLAELEEALFTADIGVRTATRLVEAVYEGMNKRTLKDPAKVWKFLKDEMSTILNQDLPVLDLDRAKPLVIMVVGVNGAGKTTSIGKLAQRYRLEGKKVMLAAGDTFRAAAVEQLEVWGERAGVEVIKGKPRQDPSSVIFDACIQASEAGADIIIADTAGRLQAKKELMEELAKIHRVIGKAIPGAPHEVWLVLDATNGQNAISQAKVFTEVVDVTGIVLTKLDGTAKGGVVIGISDEMKLPVRYIGIGEKTADLRPFEAKAFVEALLSDT